MADRELITLARELRHQVATFERRMELGRLAGQQYGGDREVWKMLGYPERVEIRFEELLGKWVREDVAGTIIDAPAEDTWSVEPEVIELDADGERVEDSQFAKDIASLFDRLDAIHKFERVDRLAGIGRYAIAVIGTKNGTDLKRPIEDDRLEGPDDILYLSLFHEGDAKIMDLDQDASSARFGQPTEYLVDLIDTEVEGGKGKGKKSVSVQETVHHSRVIHIADDLTDDEVFGRPRLERVYNRLADVVKIAGGSAEMFWSNVGGLKHVDIDADFDLAKEESGESAADILEDVADRIIEMMRKGVGGQRVIATQGAAISDIGAGTPDPSGIFSVLKELISAATRMPQRILFGSERGELASSQDERAWLMRMARRQKRFAAPVVIGGFIEAMINAGVVEVPEGHSWDVLWPDLFRLTDLERAEMASNLALAAQRLTPMGGDPKESLPVVIALAEGDIDPEDAEEIAIAANVTEELEVDGLFAIDDDIVVPFDGDVDDLDGETAAVFAVVMMSPEFSEPEMLGPFGSFDRARAVAELRLAEAQDPELRATIGEAIGVSNDLVVFEERVGLQWMPEETEAA